jgi:hypothetical protein
MMPRDPRCAAVRQDTSSPPRWFGVAGVQPDDIKGDALQPEDWSKCEGVFKSVWERRTASEANRDNDIACCFRASLWERGAGKEELKEGEERGKERMEGKVEEVDTVLSSVAAAAFPEETLERRSGWPTPIPVPSPMLLNLKYVSLLLSASLSIISSDNDPLAIFDAIRQRRVAVALITRALVMGGRLLLLTLKASITACVNIDRLNVKSIKAAMKQTKQAKACNNGMLMISYTAGLFTDSESLHDPWSHSTTSIACMKYSWNACTSISAFPHGHIMHSTSVDVP